MPAQKLNFCRGNRASKRSANLRVWGMFYQIKSEIHPVVSRMDEIEVEIAEDTAMRKEHRQANRRKTDATGGKKSGEAHGYFHPNEGRPQAGVRMVSVTKRADEENAE